MVMANRAIVWCILLVCVEACRDTLWYQASKLASSDDLTSGKFHLQARGQHKNIALLQTASRFVVDASECAKLCYVSMATLCGSAVVEQRGGGNWCRLMPWNFPCAIGRNLVASATIDSPGDILLLHCFYCNRFAGGGESGKESESVSASASEEQTQVQSTTNAQTTVAPLEPSGIVQEFSASISSARATTKIIRVMSFNTWIAGQNVRDGVNKIARHIFTNNPHVVGLQEMDDYTATRIRTLLNTMYEQDNRPTTWFHCRRNEGGSNHILTRLPIAQEYVPSIYVKNNGCQLKIYDQPARYMQVWNLHLHWEDYGPYAACKENRSPLQSVEDALFYTEYKPKEPSRSRLHQTLRFLHNKQVLDSIVDRDNPTPFMIIMGDFNSPSHLDWVPAASGHHCNASYEWPVSKLMADSGFSDSYRRVNDDPFMDPGFTWSPLYRMKTWVSLSSTEPEPQDRIDFIYYLRSNPFVNVRRSIVYKGDKEMGLFPNHSDNDWPSDHASVVTDFEVTIGPE